MTKFLVGLEKFLHSLTHSFCRHIVKTFTCLYLFLKQQKVLHLFCRHTTKGYDNLDILSGTLRVPGGRALFLSLFLNVFLFNGWGNRNRVRPAAAIRFALFRAEAELEN